ncbi:DoxX family protein [Paenibacillus sp. MBLB4367]|uniref:DoxX family protein n=1 Tax=Paenibacillus sp. MBLB4367 TaxID=3384767 RepID=UPI0039080B83
MVKQSLFFTLMRVVVGIIFLAHGIDKLESGLDNISSWFGSVGLPPFLAFLVAYVEMLGGAALIVGLGSRWAAIAFAVIMVGAIVTVKLPAGLLGDGKSAGYEIDLALLTASLYIAANPRLGYGLGQLFDNGGKA